MVQLVQKHNGYEYSSGERCSMDGRFLIFLLVRYSWGEKYWWGGGHCPMRSCDLTIDRRLVLFNKKCFHDLETERVIVCTYNFCIVN